MLFRSSMSFAFIDYLGVYALYTPITGRVSGIFPPVTENLAATLNRLSFSTSKVSATVRKGRPNPLVQNTASLIVVAILLFFLVLVCLLCVSGSEEQLSPAHDILFWDQIIQTDQSHFCPSTHFP